MPSIVMKKAAKGFQEIAEKYTRSKKYYANLSGRHTE